MTTFIKTEAAVNAAPAIVTESDGSTVIRIPPPPPAVARDELVAFPFGLEANAARDVIRRGLLVTAKIGRKRYAKRSAVLALVEVIHAEEESRRPTTKGESGDAAYLRIVGGRP